MKKYLFVILGLIGCSTSMAEIVKADAAIDSDKVNSPAVITKAAALKCPEDMVYVSGDYCPNADQKCLEWLAPNPELQKVIGNQIYDRHTGENLGESNRCGRFAPSVCLSKEKVHMEYCIDTYEYPNKKGVLPEAQLSYVKAESLAKDLGKKICSEEEWNFACEGEEMLPYPYGLERRSDFCNIDHKGVAFNPLTVKVKDFAGLYMGVPSGSMPDCKSPFGVYDMTGNVDEWATNTHLSWAKSSEGNFRSSLTGGAWLYNRNRCRPKTTAHDGRTYFFYQSGARFCKEI